MLSLALDLLTHVNVSYFQLRMIYTTHLTAILVWKLGKFFLDISKSSDIFYYDGLIYKIKSSGISYITVKLTENFFSSKC